MKKCFIAAAALLLCAATVWACFNEDPASDLSKPEVTISGGDGSSSDITVEGGTMERDPSGLFPPSVPEYPDLPDLPPNEQSRGYAAMVITSFPLTLNVAFSGFLESNGTPCTGKITRLCLLYYSTAGRWTILRDIRNPQYEVVGSADRKRALFGKYTIPSAMGYAPGDVMPVLLYFEGHNHSSFHLPGLLRSTEKVPFDNMVLGFRPIKNIRPY